MEARIEAKARHRVRGAAGSSARVEADEGRGSWTGGILCGGARKLSCRDPRYVDPIDKGSPTWSPERVRGAFQRSISGHRLRPKSPRSRGWGCCRRRAPRGRASPTGNRGGRRAHAGTAADPKSLRPSLNNARSDTPRLMTSDLNPDGTGSCAGSRTREIGDDQWPSCEGRRGCRGERGWWARGG